MRMQVRAFALVGAAAVLLALVPVAVSGHLAPGQTGKEGPGLAHLRAYVEAFNADDEASMRAFFKDHLAASALEDMPIGKRLARNSGTKRQLKSLAVERVVGDLPFQGSLLVKAGNGMLLLLTGAVEKAAPYKLVSLSIDVVENPDNIVVPDPKADEKEFLAAVKAFLEERAGADEFSGVVLVARNERVLFHEAYGFADRDTKVPNQKDTKFNLGSINKNFTRVAVLQLARQGKLALEDPIKAYLPDYPNAEAAAKVKIRHLLGMASGIGDFFGERYDATPKDKILTLRDYLPLFADKPLEFEPGTSNRYSNGGYIVLGLIVEKVSGIDYYAYVRENIFRPCGMADTDSYARDADVTNLAKGYTLEMESGRVLNFATLPGRGSSAGGGYSTAEDLLKYVLALKDGKVRLPDIANGIGIAGGAPGINSVVEWFPRSGFIVIVLSNFDPPTAGDVARQIISWLPR